MSNPTYQVRFYFKRDTSAVEVATYLTRAPDIDHAVAKARAQVRDDYGDACTHQSMQADLIQGEWIG